MSKNNESYNPYDPTGMFKEMRDASMDSWAKMMVEMVNSDGYAQAQGEMLDSWLASSTPFRKSMESAMTQTWANLNLPSRDDITRLAERLTNIEMKLDDLDASIDEMSAANKTSSPKKEGRSNSEEGDK